MFPRCRMLKNFEVAVGLFLIWVVTVLVFRHIWGTCRPSHGYSCATTIVASDGSNPGTVKPNTPVYVFEEHHEALLYWFDAAEKGYISREGNVLLHIDGHSDGATPERRDILPVFRLPTLREIHNMMQRNDVFIAASAVTGLIRRYIWVLPPWDTSTGELGPNANIVIKVQIGTVSRLGLDNKVMEDFCACWLFAEDEGTLLSPGFGCYMANLTDPYTDDGTVPINADRCKIHLHDGLVEMVSETEAINLMKTGHWITPLDSVILDIDEDYYGCEAAVQPLYDVKVTESMLMWIGYYTRRLFCPTQPREEMEADKFFAHLIDYLVNFKQFCARMKNATGFCTDKTQKGKYLLNASEELFGNILERNLRPILCRSDTVAKRVIFKLLMFLRVFKPEQLKAMKEIGICFNQSPRTLIFNPSDGMRTCDGFNRPNQSAVPFHTPSEQEVTFRTSQLKVMLSSEGLHPGIVTVCRSMRDGYTPRKLFRRIENDVLGVLDEAFETVSRNSIFYDPYLLGGATGWPGRH